MFCFVLFYMGLSLCPLGINSISRCIFPSYVLITRIHQFSGEHILKRLYNLSLNSIELSIRHDPVWQIAFIILKFHTFFSVKCVSKVLRKLLSDQRLCSLRRRRLIGIVIPIINLRRSDDGLRIMMGIPISIRRCLLNSLRPSDAYMRQENNHHWFR